MSKVSFHAPALLLLATAMWSPPAAAGNNDLGHGYLGLGFGPGIGNAYGGVAEIEVGGGAVGSYFAGILHGMAGANYDGNAIFMPGLGLGYRGVMGHGRTRFTMFLGPMILYKAEVSPGMTWHYTTGWARMHFGMVQSGSWGLEAGIGLGYQHHWAEDTGYPYYGPDYSGFSGTLDVLWHAFL